MRQLILEWQKNAGCHFLILLSFCASFITPVFGQNTVGLISLDRDDFSDGYNMFYSHNQSTVYLINNCGEIVHSWDDDDDFRPGNMAYLLENGNLVRCKRPNNSTLDSIAGGGGGAIIEVVDWDGNILSSFFQNDTFKRLHHDVAVLPNGHILAISWELKRKEEAIQAGRDPESLTFNKLWPDYVLEWDPDQDTVVWEWHAWDHLVQDIDTLKDNFGVVSDHPELIDINWNTNEGLPDWMHTNGINYNEDLDQIMLCVPAFHEIWVIDHSTSTEEARGHAGGLYGKGGDLLFRWGNPQTYRAPGDQKLFWPHDAHWIDQSLDPSHPQYGQMVVFNNRVHPDYSTANIFVPLTDEASGEYELSEMGNFLPEEFSLTLLHPDTFPIQSNGLSSVQVLENKNLLILSGRTGHVFEINPATNQVVWEYIIPLKGGSPVAQGEILEVNNNITFRFTRYPSDFPAFDGRDLTPKGYLELEPNILFCDLLTPTDDIKVEMAKVYPNPTDGSIKVTGESLANRLARILDVRGQVLYSRHLETEETILELGHLTPGIYFLWIDDSRTNKIVVY